MTDTLTRESTTLDLGTIELNEVDFLESNEPESASHIVLVPESLKEEYSSPQAYVLAARIEGFQIQALCGHVFIPQSNPQKLPLCSTCKEIYQNDPFGHNDRDRLPDA